MKNYKPHEFGELIGVSVRTLQRWDKSKKLIAFRTPKGRRFYTEQQYEDYLNGNFNKFEYLDKLDINYFKNCISELLEEYTIENIGVVDCIEKLEKLSNDILGLRYSWFIFAGDSIPELLKPVLKQLENEKKKNRVTTTIDKIKCVYCGHEFDETDTSGNYKLDYALTCPKCGKQMSVSTTKKYICQPLD